MSEPIQIPDLPDPGMDELQQRPVEMWAPPNIPVTIEGIPRVLLAPNRRSAATSTIVATGDRPVNILGAELDRAVATLIGNGDWRYHVNKNTAFVPWPSGVPLVVTHSNAVYASTTAANPVTISCIAEYHGD